MRRVSLLLISLGMLATLAGCHSVTGRCDCVDLPPAVIPPPPIHPAPPVATVAPITTVAPVVSGVSVEPQAVANPMPAKVEWSKVQPVAPEQGNPSLQVLPESGNK